MKNPFTEGMNVTFKKEKDIEIREGGIRKINKLLPKNMAEIITAGEDISETVSLDIVKPDYNLREYCLFLIGKGKKFKIDFKEKTLHVDKKLLLSKEMEFLPLRRENKSIVEVLDEIERLYCKYKRSIPSQEDESHPSKYFRALPEENLSNEDMMFGERRNIARFNLEFYVLEKIITGELRWDTDIFGEKSWFWQSLKDKSLVIFKEWTA